MNALTRHAGVAAVIAIVAATVIAAPCSQRVVGPASDSAKYGLGPEMTEYMTFIEAEIAELTHLRDEGDVGAADYRISRDRLDVTREAAIRIARTRSEDRVPDLYVLVDSELTQILPAGAAALRGKKVGDIVGGEFIFHGRIRRQKTFNILERTGNIRRASPYSPD